MLIIRKNHHQILTSFDWLKPVASAVAIDGEIMLVIFSLISPSMANIPGESFTNFTNFAIDGNTHRKNSGNICAFRPEKNLC